jgi:hypothetical protein
MLRRRKLWLILLLVFAIIAIGGVWMYFDRRDPDFHVIGPKTKGVRANLALLERTIDAAEFHDCKTLDDVAVRLDEKLRPFADKGLKGWRPYKLRVDSSVTPRRDDVLSSPVEYPAEATPMTVKDFLRFTFRQVTDEEFGFVVSGYFIQATTSAEIQAARARYQANVPLLDRLRNVWRDVIGEAEDDPVEIRMTQ